MNINWAVRFKNKAFWLAFIPAVMVLIKAVAEMLGFTLDLTEVGNQLVEIVEAVFLLLGILGIVVDPTTKGLSDSERAMNYTEPN